jgi:hypothetical protein
VRNGVILFTAKKAYNSQFLGMPYIYNYVELGENCTPWSPQSITKTSSMAVWMSKQGMFSFDGTSILPMNCLVRPWVDSDIDLLQVREQACMVHVGDFNEVWWFFPQDGFSKNSRCIIYSYKEGWWSMGRMARTAGITSSYTAHTIMADDIGVRYILPAFPFAHLIGGFGLATLLQMEAKWVRASAVILCAWVVLAAVGIYPDRLSYFNEAACLLTNPREIGIDGGTRCGPHFLDDSNVDWGQSLKQVKAWIDGNAKTGSRVLAQVVTLHIRSHPGSEPA